MTAPWQDRFVLARAKNGLLVIRYDRRGHYYLEDDHDPSFRRLLPLAEAVRLAVMFERGGGTVTEGCIGATRFDAKVATARAASQTGEMVRRVQQVKDVLAAEREEPDDDDDD